MIKRIRSEFNFGIFLNLIRALFPNWNFFDKIDYKFSLEFKIKNSKTWEPISFLQKREPFSLFVNAQTNIALAQINIIEHFVQDIQKLQIQNPLIHSRDVNKLTTYKMLKSLLVLKISEYELQNPTLQFKIVGVSPQDRVDIYLSDEITLGTE